MSSYTLDSVSVIGCFKIGDRQQYTLTFNGLNVGHRNYGDFLRLSHKRKHKNKINEEKEKDEDEKLLEKVSQSDGLPKKSLNLISKGKLPWVRNGQNWRIELTGSVRRIEQWLLAGLNDEEYNKDTLYFLSLKFDEDKLKRNQETSSSCLDDMSNQSVQWNARDMQQYFCTEVNLNALVKAAFKDNTATSSFNTDMLNHDKRKFVLIEPSCGDGRILAHILARKENDNTNGATAATVEEGDDICIVSAVGIDLDKDASNEAKEKLSHIHQFKSGYELNHIPILCHDFLETNGQLLASMIEKSRQKVKNDIISYDLSNTPQEEEAINSLLPWPPLLNNVCKCCHKLTVDNHGTSALNQSELTPSVMESECKCEHLEVMVVGGPPYSDYTQSTSEGIISSNSSSIRGSEIISKRAKHVTTTDNIMSFQGGFRSLPFKFIIKAVKPIHQGGLGASRVAYLLPSRCGKPEFIKAVKETLEVMYESLNVMWEISCTTAPDKHFMFKGRLVPQPSVVFVLNKIHMGR